MPSHQPSYSDDLALQPLVFPSSSSRSSMASSNAHHIFQFQRRRRNSNESIQNPFADATKRKLLVRSYAPDWVITIGLACAFFALDKVSGYKREFSLDDISLHHTFTEHVRVPDWALYLICGVAPLCLQPVINLLTVRSFWDLHNSTLGLVLALSLTGVVTQFTKITVGRPRPDLIARCIPKPGSVDPQWGLSTAEICTQTGWYMLEDGFRSFPSGHSSMSFAGLGHLSFYLSGKLHLFDKQGHAPKAWLALTPLSGAALVAISRTMDYRHHWQDVLTGSILGLTLAYFSYRQYYPSLSSETSHRPYAPRISKDEGEGPILPVHRTVDSTLGMGHEMGGHVGGMGMGGQRYTDFVPGEGEGVPEGTEPRPERTGMQNLWKDEDGDGDEDATVTLGTLQSHP